MSIRYRCHSDRRHSGICVIQTCVSFRHKCHSGICVIQSCVIEALVSLRHNGVIQALISFRDMCHVVLGVTLGIGVMVGISVMVGILC